MQVWPEQGSPERFSAGIERFNSHRFWDAHEEWETIWLASHAELREFLQGLIQLAAAYHHVQRGTLSGAVRLFASARRRLLLSEEGFCGILHGPLIAVSERHQMWAEEQLSRVGAGGSAGIERFDPSNFPKIEESGSHAERQ
ncbi:MAG TPA: DUF309 domain-containing protein [Thermoanaerobaculia bacterium]|nr:DUF309 domain-containing protein [Thermoanaerobaculia bacterium]